MVVVVAVCVGCGCAVTTAAKHDKSAGSPYLSEDDDDAEVNLAPSPLTSPRPFSEYKSPSVWGDVGIPSQCPPYPPCSHAPPAIIVNARALPLLPSLAAFYIIQL
jgi:hypothetical protein